MQKKQEIAYYFSWKCKQSTQKIPILDCSANIRDLYEVKTNTQESLSTWLEDMKFSIFLMTGQIWQPARSNVGWRYRMEGRTWIDLWLVLILTHDPASCRALTYYRACIKAVCLSPCLKMKRFWLGETFKERTSKGCLFKTYNLVKKPWLTDRSWTLLQGGGEPSINKDK